MKLVGDFVAVLFHGLCVVGDNGASRVGSGGGIVDGSGGGSVGDGGTSGIEAVGTYESWGGNEPGGGIGQGRAGDHARLRGGGGNSQNAG